MLRYSWDIMTVSQDSFPLDLIVFGSRVVVRLEIGAGYVQRTH